MELAALKLLCGSVRDEFTTEVNAAVAVLDPGAAASSDAFAAHGPIVLFNYPAALHPTRRTAMLPSHRFLGSSIRAEKVTAEIRQWLDEDDDRPLVYVSFGSFLSARADVLARVVEALRPLPVRVAFATGSADPAVLGDLPAHWLVESFLPQVAILERSALAISHGGNNSITEALNFEVPLLVLPFSTDQFAGAAAIETAQHGVALDPNVATPEDLRRAVSTALRR